MSDKQFIQQAISLATENVKVGGRPFGAVIVKNGQVIAHAVNQITATNDPTAHAELLALREAGKFYAYSNDDAQPYGLSTANIAKALRVAPEQQEGLQFVQIKPEDEKQPALYQLWSQQS
ncbi:TPA: nucleoside deaminase [Proteus mirabilis]|nr:nucleoside deaminase [Proteus mirabilis]